MFWIVDIPVRELVTNVMVSDSTRSVIRFVTDLWCVVTHVRRNVDCHVTVQRDVAQDVVTANVSWFVQNHVLPVKNHVSENVLTRSVIFSVASHAWRILVMSPVTTFCCVDMIVLVSVAIPVRLSVELVTRILTHLKYLSEH